MNGMMPSPTQALREEHRVILRALELLEAAADRSSGAPPPSDAWWGELLDWLQRFADLSHHGKEERHLFPALVRAGVPSDGGPVGVMLAEHAEGRALIGLMADGPADRRAAAARRYVGLLRDHIDKENGVLLPLADIVLDDEAQLRVGRGFAEIEAARESALPIELGEARLDRLAAALTG